MAVTTRPYFMVYNGIQRMVEAASPAAAVKHVVDAEITELRPARGGEVMAWIRAKKEIEIAGRKPGTLPAEGATGDDAEPKWHAGDCAVWIEGQTGDVEAALEIWKKIVIENYMKLEDFDSMREAIPVFAETIGDGRDETPWSIEQVRGEIEEQEMPLHEVVRRIGERKRWELYGDHPPVDVSETPDPLEAQ